MTIPRLEVVQRTGSTNTDLLEMAGADPAAWPHLSVLLAREQTAGKGRAGRTWQSGDLWALTFSVVLRPRVDRQRWGWIPLVAGLAVVRTLRATIAAAGGGAGAGERIGLKWPNDIVDVHAGAEYVDGWGTMRKLGGILTEVMADGEGVVVGIGVNLAGSELPVAHAGTLAASGIVPPGPGTEARRATVARQGTEPGPGPETGGGVGSGRESGTDRQTEADQQWAEAMMRAIVTQMGELLTDLQVPGPTARAVEQVCVSIGAPVQADLPDGTPVRGVAQRLAPDGALVVHTHGGPQVIRAGDIRHLRAPAALD